MTRGGSSGGGLPAAVAALGLEKIIEAVPAALVITDRDGEVLYRNRAATALVSRVAAEFGSGAAEQLRHQMRESLRRNSTVPFTDASRLAGVSGASGDVWTEMTVDRLGDCYLLVWREITQENRRSALLTQLADELTDALDVFTATGEELMTEIAEVSTRSETVAAGAGQLTASIREISSSAAAAASNTGSAVSSAGTASDRILKLSESSAQIGSIGKLINSIAEQTNLLALNATIEAARAGAAGKGFAVVAGEVKDLAHRTSEATSRIASMIEAIQSDSTGTAAIIQEIVDLIGQIEAEQSRIAGAVEEQSTTAAQISDSVAAVAAAAAASRGTLPNLDIAARGIAAKIDEVRAAL